MPSTVKLVVAALVLGVLAVTLWPAGGTPLSPRAYNDRLTEVMNDWPSQPTSFSPSGLEAIADDLDDLGGRLADITPPAEVRAEHDRFVAATRGEADAMRKAADAVADGPDAMRAVAPELAAAGIEWNAARTALGDHGYAPARR